MGKSYFRCIGNLNGSGSILQPLQAGLARLYAASFKLRPCCIKLMGAA
jgi:hypothetical protein